MTTSKLWRILFIVRHWVQVHPHSALRDPAVFKGSQKCRINVRIRSHFIPPVLCISAIFYSTSLNTDFGNQPGRQERARERITTVQERNTCNWYSSATLWNIKHQSRRCITRFKNNKPRRVVEIRPIILRHLQFLPTEPHRAATCGNSTAIWRAQVAQRCGCRHSSSSPAVQRHYDDDDATKRGTYQAGLLVAHAVCDNKTA